MPLIAAEDTRHTRRLLDRHGDRDADDELPRPERRRARTAALLDHLRGGADLALVTDAGTPAVSDPGGELVAAWAAEGGRVVPIPGASAVLAAVAASGVAGPRWAFEGFLPRTGRERRERLDRIAADERGTVVFEAPGRVAATLRDLADGVRRRAARRRLPRADQAARDDRARHARRAGGRAPGPRAGSRRAASSSLVVGAWPDGRSADAGARRGRARSMRRGRARSSGWSARGCARRRGRAAGRGRDRAARAGGSTGSSAARLGSRR